MRPSTTVNVFWSCRPSTPSNLQPIGWGCLSGRPSYDLSMRPLFFVLTISLSLVASAATVSDRFDTIAKQAETARAQDRVQDSIRLYREGTRLRPSWTDGWWYLGSLLFDQDRFSEAN